MSTRDSLLTVVFSRETLASRIGCHADTCPLAIGRDNRRSQGSGADSHGPGDAVFGQDCGSWVLRPGCEAPFFSVGTLSGCSDRTPARVGCFGYCLHAHFWFGQEYPVWQATKPMDAIELVCATMSQYQSGSAKNFKRFLRFFSHQLGSRCLGIWPTRKPA